MKTLTVPATTGTQNGKFRRHFHIKSCLNLNDGASSPHTPFRIIAAAPKGACAAASMGDIP